MAPERRQHITLDFDSFNPFGIFRDLNRRNNLGGLHLYRLLLFRIKGNLLYLAEEITGRPAPILSFPLIHVHPEDMAIGPIKPGIFIKYSLNIVLAGG